MNYPDHALGHTEDSLSAGVKLPWKKTERKRTHTHTHNHFMALLDFVRNYPGELAP